MAKKTRAVKSTPIENTIHLRTIKPLTPIQKSIFESYEAGKHLLLHGRAGTGKTFVATFLAIRDMLVHQRYNKIIIVRSPRQSVDVGHMPGNLKEKLGYFEDPYENTVNDLCESPVAYRDLKNRSNIQFVSTAYLRGVSFDNAIVILDEAQNCSPIECDTVATRVGENTRLIVLGDVLQQDFMKNGESGFRRLINIMGRMNSVALHELTSKDVVRSGFVKDYLAALEATEAELAY